MNEIWKDITGYEGLYQISSWGRVKSFHRNKEKLLKLNPVKDGYLCVYLFKNGKGKQHQVHRLVAQAFIPNPDNLPCVNHKDEVKTNNHVGNLEFCSYQYNNTYGTAIQRRKEKRLNGVQSKTVYQYTLDGEFVAEYPSTREVERQLGFYQTAISSVCLGKGKTYKGYIWRYKEPQSN